MYKLLLPIVWLLFCCHVSQSQLRLPSNEGKKPAQLKLAIEDGDAATGLPFSKTTLKLPITNLKGQPSTFETTDFKLKDPNPETDPYGLQHYHYVQTINGIEVDGAEMRVHVKNGQIDSQTGNWLLDVPARLQQLRASQSADAILRTVETSLKGKKISSQTLTTSPVGNNANARAAAVPDNAKLVYVPIGRDLEAINPDSVRLAYRFTVKTGTFSNFMYYVDATNGEVLYKIDLVCRFMGAKQHTHTAVCSPTDPLIEPPVPTLAPPPTVTESIDANSTLWTRYSGSQKAITTKRSDGKWSLKDLSRGINILHVDSLVAINDSTAKEYSSYYFNNSNQWRLKSENDIDAFARDALWGGQVTKDFFTQKMGGWYYNTINYGRNMKIYANTDFVKIFEEEHSINALFTGDEVVIGQGDAEFKINPLSALDIVAHEITHGIIAGTSGLRYLNESGAINESISDIFGTAVERYKRPERWNWTIGEDCGLTLRSMSNPRAYEQPSEYGGKNFHNYLVDFSDKGGVHMNSGIMNRWFYLLCTGGKGTNEAGNAYDVTAIEMDDALKIVYLAQKDYITPSMNFYNVSLATFRAARDIFGADAVQTKQVQKAWAAVNVVKISTNDNCKDTHEPNNTYKAATNIKTDVAVFGNLEDFAYSEYNKGEYNSGDNKMVPNAEKYSDWYTFTTTNDKPNVQLRLSTYFADQMTITLYKDKADDDHMVAESASTENGHYVAGDIDAKLLQKSILIDPCNDVKGHRFYVKISYGYNNGLAWKAINNLSNGCYELVANTSSKAFPVVDNIKVFSQAVKRYAEGNFYYIMNVNEKEKKRYKFLSLPNDKQLQTGVQAVQRSFDYSADQIWQFTNSKPNGDYNYTYALKNLNSDKVLEIDSKGKVYQSDFDKNKKSQELSLSLNLISGSWDIFSPSDFRNLSVSDTVTNSVVKIRKADCGDPPCSMQNWMLYEAEFLNDGEYIVRSVKNKQVLSLSGKSLQVAPYSEAPEQRWIATYNKDGRYLLTNKRSGLALNLPNANPADAVAYNAVSADKNVQTQNWKLLPRGKDQSIKIVNSSTNKAVSAAASGSVAQYSYNGSNYQGWYLDKVQILKSGYYSIKNRATGLYMDVPGADKTNGAKLITYPSNGAYNQLFYVQAQPDGSYVIENVSSEKALSTNSDTDNQLYQWETDVNKPNHKWRIVYTSDGFFKVVSVFNGKVAQAGKNASTARKGSPVVQENYQLNNHYQQWNFRILGSPEDKSVQSIAQIIEPASSESTAGLTIFPNPAQNRVTVAYDLAEGETATIKLLNLTGTGLMSQPAEPRQTVLDVSQVDTGLYFISLETNTGKRKTQKLVIQK